MKTKVAAVGLLGEASDDKSRLGMRGWFFGEQGRHVTSIILALCAMGKHQSNRKQLLCASSPLQCFVRNGSKLCKSDNSS